MPYMCCFFDGAVLGISCPADQTPYVYVLHIVCWLASFIILSSCRHRCGGPFQKPQDHTETMYNVKNVWKTNKYFASKHWLFPEINEWLFTTPLMHMKSLLPAIVVNRTYTNNGWPGGLYLLTFCRYSSFSLKTRKVHLMHFCVKKYIYIYYTMKICTYLWLTIGGWHFILSIISLL